MTVRAAEIVAAARGWIGTPYVHQACCKTGGADCLGLTRGVWAEVQGVPPAAVPAYTADWSEVEGDEALWRAAQSYLIEMPRSEMAEGDVLLFRMRRGAVAKHLGILTQAGVDARFIHSYAGHGVVENALSAPWRRRIVACFSFPDGRSTWRR